jgi:hypothetical protein
MAFHPFDLCENSVTGIGVNPEIPIASTSCDYAKLSTASVNPLGLGLLERPWCVNCYFQKSSFIRNSFLEIPEKFSKKYHGSWFENLN